MKTAPILRAWLKLRDDVGGATNREYATEYALLIGIIAAGTIYLVS
jgi:Flp pilus assembly pilin Flp